ncbi:MAG: hypothetical protein HYZ49_09560 [Chloroflexi bacterium]|nr:hypothetical protein [Chloroflexota bacterium]
MPHRRPGWALPNGHIVRSQLEAALCDFLVEAAAPHAHWPLNFNVLIAPKQWLLYIPSIVLNEALKKDGRAILVEPVNSVQPGGGVRRLEGFRSQHAHQYFVVVVARRALQRRISKDAYDAIFPEEDFEPLGDFLRKL